ncbi:restriction endonuclease [Listeria seeligeri]|uniref:restriction endonuclease n=1 Tax=Listeria seeligeri TaxID=1640 RepID=UPI0022EA2E20|nr:restriction endonuclease [Listeria seeligeri]
MADINYIEKSYFEDLFGMSSGYVLDFSNRSFQEFIFDSIQIDIYAQYPELSKAKILRNLIKDYDNLTVGKLLLELLTYMKIKKLVNSDTGENFKECARIGRRLIGKEETEPNAPSSTASPEIVNDMDFEYFKDKLSQLAQLDDPRKRGFAFEKYLKELFDSANLNPRGSFKIIGEQIDGSFELNNAFYLLEAKWTGKKAEKSDLVIFNEKVSSKSGYTRGLFISYSGYGTDAVSTLSHGRTINIILMTCEELAISLSRGINIRDIITDKTRALAEEGNCYKSVF